MDFKEGIDDFNHLNILLRIVNVLQAILFDDLVSSRSFEIVWHHRLHSTCALSSSKEQVSLTVFFAALTAFRRYVHIV